MWILNSWVNNFDCEYLNTAKLLKTYILRCVIEISNINEFIIIGTFLWSTTTICSSLLVLQAEIVQSTFEITFNFGVFKSITFIICRMLQIWGMRSAHHSLHSGHISTSWSCVSWVNNWPVNLSCSTMSWLKVNGICIRLSCSECYRQSYWTHNNWP